MPLKISSFSAGEPGAPWVQHFQKVTKHTLPQAILSSWTLCEQTEKILTDKSSILVLFLLIIYFGFCILLIFNVYAYIGPSGRQKTKQNKKEKNKNKKRKTLFYV